MLLHRVQRFEEHFEQSQLKRARRSSYKRSSCIDNSPTLPLLNKSVDLGFIDSVDPVHTFELSSF